MIDYYSFCMIHGKYYSGWCECPICREEKESLKDEYKKENED